MRLICPLILACLLTACSSLEKVTHYRVDQSTGDADWSYRATGVGESPTSHRGFPAKLIFQNRWRWFQFNRYQYAKITFASYGTQEYAIGPLLLPIIPNFGLGAPERKIDLDSDLAFTLSFWSDPKIEDVTAELPTLNITTDRGQMLKPRISAAANGGTTFVYDVRLRDLPWFTLREARIKLSNGRTLTIPETKFKLGKTIAWNLLIPIAP